MREYKLLLQNLIREAVVEYRIEHGLSQEAVAEILHIAPRSYFDQEHGKYSFSALSMMFFLVVLEDDRIVEFVRCFQCLAEKNESDAMREHPLVYTSVIR